MVGFPLDSRVTYATDPDTGAITPQYDRAVTSKPLKAYIRGIITTGVLPNPSDNLQVFPGTDGMTVIVHAGFAVIDGGLAKEDNNRTLEVTASDATYDRIDTVVVRWNDNDSVRNVDLYIKQGAPARNPVRPTLTREGSVYEIGLADIFVTKNVRTITAEKITDTRLESSRCGVASSIAKWDTTTIYRQIQSDLAGFKSNEQAEFMAWFNRMKDQLTTDAAGRLQTEVDNLKDSREVLRSLPNIEIPANTDINTSEYLNIGTYYCPSIGAALTISNIPVKMAFGMYVIAPLGGAYGSESSAMWTYRVRILITFDGDIYVQGAFSSETAGVYTYSNWKKLVSSDELTSITNSDIDTILNS